MQLRALRRSWIVALAGIAILAAAIAGLIWQVDLLVLGALTILCFVSVERMALLLSAERRLREARKIEGASHTDLRAAQRRLSLTAAIWAIVLIVYAILVLPEHERAVLALSMGAILALFRSIWMTEDARERALAQYGVPIRGTWQQTALERAAFQKSLAKLRLQTAQAQEGTMQIEKERDEAIEEWIQSEDARKQSQSRIDDLSARVSDLLERLQRANSRLPAELQVPEQGDLGKDERAARLLYEVREAYATRFGGETDSSPLAPIRVGWDFLASLERVQVPRKKVVEVIGEIASRRAWRMEGRQVHRLRAGTGAEAATVIRERDGAKAWRCALKRGTPSAPRLHWWELADGSIELANIVTHDDFNISQ